MVFAEEKTNSFGCKAMREVAMSPFKDLRVFACIVRDFIWFGYRHRGIIDLLCAVKLTAEITNI